MTKSTAKKSQPRQKSYNRPAENHYTNPPKSLEDHIFYGMRLDKDQKKFRDAIWSPDKVIIFSDSPAGTGKTTIAVATASLLVKYGFYEGLTYIVSPNCEGKIGFLPGTVDQKVEVYNTPLYQALIESDEQPERAVVQNGDASKKDGAWVDFIPHTFLRGANLKNRVIILDESQNYSLLDLKKTLTRCHDSSKVIVIGHNGQRDVYRHGESAFSRYIKHFEGDSRTAVCPLTKNYRGWLANHADALMDLPRSDMQSAA